MKSGSAAVPARPTRAKDSARNALLDAAMFAPALLYI